MPTPERLKHPFEPNCWYHIVFKSIDGLVLFHDHEDYVVFLQKFHQFTDALLDVWAYSMLNNHVHFIVKAKPLNVITGNIEAIDLAKQTKAMKNLLFDPENLSLLDSVFERQVNSFMVSFVSYINKKYGHSGGLFQSPFKRIRIDNEIWLQQAVIYVHGNCVKHKVFDDYRSYPYSSYLKLLRSNHPHEVFSFFGGRDKFVEIHKAQVEYFYRKGFPDSKLE